MKQHFSMMAAYNRWANSRVYEAAAKLSDEELNRPTGAFFPTLMRTLNHVLVADRIWLKRFTGEGEAPAALDTVLFAALPALSIAREAEDERVVRWVGGLSEKDLAGRFTYVTVTDVRTVSQRLAPALSHFFNHQTHHRGQAHTILTTLGKPSLQLDMIYFQRTPDGLPFA
ncbi:MAG: damage-inducible protein DinB [Rhizobiaceae bacterium]|nr:damage-inducible protein DinB [Rhizobiaceae bacterium]